MKEYFNDNGDFTYTAKERCSLEIRTTCEFHVNKNDMLIGPNASTERFFRTTLESDDVVDVYCSERYTIVVSPLPSRGEKLDPNSMCEVIEEGELSIYDQLRQEMLSKLSQMAGDKDYDTYEDDDDLGWDDPDTETPLTPYEYAEMHEETIQPIQETDASGDPIPKPEAPTLSEQPAETPAEL